MVKECTTVNGNATLVLNEATFADCIILQSVIMEEAKKLKLDIGDMDISLNVSSMSNLLDNIKDLFFGLMTSDKFDRIIFKCLGSCTYNGVKITKQLFDDMPEARQDYYQIIKECVEINLNPFLKSLTSQLSTLFTIPMSENQESNTQEVNTDL